MNRQYIFNHYWWIGPLVGSIFASCAWVFGGEGRASLVTSVVAGVLAFCYFVQRQKLSETTLFHELFTSFNARYAEMNGRLAELAKRGNPPSREDRDLVVDYFNLCAEEYLFYKEGYVHRDAWKSWCRGMLRYLRRHPFKDIWHEELSSDSYYGLSLEVIEKGAA